MPITYDKKSLQKSRKYLKMGKKKYALKKSFITAIFQAIFVPIFITLIDRPFSLDKFISIFLLIFIVNFIIYYFIYLKDWKNMNDIYQDSLEYFKENNPDFIKDILEENLETNK